MEQPMVNPQSKKRRRTRSVAPETLRKRRRSASAAARLTFTRDTNQRCQLCKFVPAENSSVSSLKEHARRHGKYFRFACAHCDFKSHYSQAVRNHGYAKHQLEREFVVDKRNELTQAAWDIIYAQCFPHCIIPPAEMDENEPTHECRSCKELVKESHLYRHIMEKHESQMMCKCSLDDCSLLFVNKVEHDEHARTVHNVDFSGLPFPLHVDEDNQKIRRAFFKFEVTDDETDGNSQPKGRKRRMSE
ncbi:hypothetical protein PFISCL1PPCAC_1192 [Pristionchus fissidentatus]|uniref:C2H2-type domain-containing protein n=1 Tax=Pristionchus fissidentatus TaxID=1538716 RepID=A0AAV5UUR8_9BILA|nr:hypothetical protein PFISCL1PPCAC_1192 [Pristionchus fissidentatus]